MLGMYDYKPCNFYLMLQQGGRVATHDERRKAAEDATCAAGSAGCSSGV